MARKRFTLEQIITHLRQVEILVSGRKTTGKACRQLGEHFNSPLDVDIGNVVVLEQHLCTPDS